MFSLIALCAGAPRSSSYQSPASSSRTRTAPIAIVRSTLNSPGTPGFERAFDYSFESENGIRQEAVGQLKTVGDSDVMVMRGSYEFVGDDGQNYQMNWYADETGYHAEAEHLPKSVPIPDPEHAALIEAQVRFAAEERNAAESRQTPTKTYSEPEVRVAPTQTATYVRPNVRVAATNSFVQPNVRVAPSSPVTYYLTQDGSAVPVEVVEVGRAGNDGYGNARFFRRVFL